MEHRLCPLDSYDEIQHTFAYKALHLTPRGIRKTQILLPVFYGLVTRLWPVAGTQKTITLSKQDV